MSRLPAPHEPARVFRNPQRLWDDCSRNSTSLGCHSCLEFDRCGGVHTNAGIMDCRDLCSCSDKSRCDMVCRFSTRHFIARMREVRGTDFPNAPRVPAVAVPTLPRLVALLDHRYSRSKALPEPLVGLSLYQLVNLQTGKLHVSSREALARRFLIASDAKIVLSGVGKDRPIERWWELPNRAAILEKLRNLGVVAITSPNYSVLTDVPRTDNLHAMKRILLAWTEMAGAGLAAALHVNARTDHDYGRWTRLIAERQEIGMIAFEFATGCGRGERMDWHVEQLCKLADEVKRPLSLIVRGGARKAPLLRRHFAQVTLLDTEPFARALRRRRAVLTEGGILRWAKDLTNPGEPLDDLMAHNVSTVRLAHDNEHVLTVARVSAAPPKRAANRNNEAASPGLFGHLELPGETGRIAPQAQHMRAAAKA